MLVDYGSDSESDGEQQQVTSKPTPSTNKPTATTVPALIPGLPKPRRRDGPLKITLEAPKREAEDDLLKERPLNKKPKLTGAGGSSLLAMLPPPKNKNVNQRKTQAAPAPQKPFLSDAFLLKGVSDDQEAEDTATSSLSLLPPSRIAKTTGNPAKPPLKEEPEVDFFSLETTTSTKKFAHIPPATDLLPPSKTAAPSVKEYVPPPPAPTDPYPGYYQKPDGQWAAYEPEYYWSIAKVWQPVPSSSTDSARSRKRQWEGDEEDFRQVSALDEASRARAEIEQTKSITAEVIHAGPTAPNMKMTAARSSNVAKSRHQLSTLLTDAYTHRAEIEDKIAMAKRNRKESGNKYGF